MISLYRVLVLGLGCLIACAVISGPELTAQQKFDPENAFRRFDSNGDGKLSRDEWKKFADVAPKLKDNAKAREFVFDRLDADKDGFLTLEEFKKLGTLSGKGKDAPPKLEPKITPIIDKPATADQLAFFEKSIRPVLVKECYSCHSAESPKLKGGLALDTRAGLRQGGDSGPSIVPGDPKKSVLMKALRHQDETLAMPPKKKLADDVVADFEKWIALGAADPREGGSKLVKPEIDIEKGRSFWAFQLPKKSAPPAVNATAWPRSEIDRFLLADMEAKGAKPVADADPRTLLRRLYFDLVGLPPTAEEVSTFLHEYSASPQPAVEKVVDRLLASPRFGERWGRHWLDVARFAESSGKQANFAYPNAWRYRDYVIAAFNADKPYNQFIREQLAGDLLDPRDEKQKAEFLIATGFLAIGPKAHNERMPLQFQMDLVDEQIDATFVAFQGMTVACARCHDHKFDPIPTTDYYALAGIFRGTETCYGTVRVIQNNHPSSLLTLPRGANVSAALEPLTPSARSEMEKQLKEFKDQLAALPLADRVSMKGIRFRIQSANLESKLASYEADGTPKSQAMGVREKSLPTDSVLFVRGEIDQPGVTVKRGFPHVMTTEQPSIGRGSGRLELANWIASSNNPLTARVMVNRIWQHLYGRGLVATPDNFGAAGQLPDHPVLLDYLANQFVSKGWSTKKMIRSLVLSRSYQLSSQFDDKNYEIDPDNVLVWRMNKRRLEAEAMRDAMLAVSGTLDPAPPKSDPVARNGEGNVGLSFRRRPVDSFTSDSYRSVYLPIIRDLLPEALTLFDFPDPTLISGQRAVTTIPAQSLYLMNNPFVIQQAEIVADKLLASGGGDVERVEHAYLSFFSRPPSAKEQKGALEFIDRYSKESAKEKPGPERSRRYAWSALCQSLFASAEFSHR